MCVYIIEFVRKHLKFNLLGISMHAALTRDIVIIIQGCLRPLHLNSYTHSACNYFLYSFSIFWAHFALVENIKTAQYFSFVSDFKNRNDKLFSSF